MERRVVISGMGIYSVLGKNLEEVTSSLYKGKSGIGLDLKRKELGFRSMLTGVLERPNLKKLLNRRQRVGIPEQGEYAYMATLEAFENAKIDMDFLEKNEVGILYGNDSSSIPVIESIDRVRETKDTTLLGSGSIFQSMNSTITMNLSVIFKLKGINFTISGACASSSHAVGMAYFLIKHGYQDIVLCGGGQEINPESMGSFDGLSAFSVRHDAPQQASRPFDRDRDGLIPSGGGASLVVESLESALNRGADIVAEIKGYGFSSNGDHISVPNEIGPTISLERCLKDAKMAAKEIDYVNAHATSTPVGDSMEGKALGKLFSDLQTPISSTKSMTGHEMWMGGASELIYSSLMMHNSFIAPNINFENPDEVSAKLNIINKTTEKELDTILSNSFGFGGTNSTIILSKYRK
ncbi:beta-ketoacyl-[acyl-carrier-protein] synthase family protein [Plebeiibacterium marinum]|uniref:Beta-ketoacyl-[acyl-carrier-protein] synthase family protein n=1 Tax=Plebeiibacterium marinum TaxID=2992111 RepID=A0AAE3MEC0_9BACT|nr:beta-ketoacyl-[acyl-carrier-protein] synthase family protein [Plebeiobacterium marinum]MCW3806040.1 beta-ketoacyl-[acyl-carrier-protein] synthase family protein [Plebeiobacterium marinum]